MKKKELIKYNQIIDKRLISLEQYISDTKLINEQNKNIINNILQDIKSLKAENEELKKLILFNTEKISNLIKDTNDTNKRLLSKNQTVVNDYYQNLIEIASGNFEDLKQNEKQ